MSNTMYRTREQVEAHLERVQSARIARLVRRIMDEFVTVGAFLDATKGSLMAVYRKVHPEAKYELGRMFYRAYDEARRYCNEPDAPAPAPAAEAVKPESRPAPALSFTLPQLKALCNIMDLCSIQSVDVSRMALFLNACDATIPDGI